MAIDVVPSAVTRNDDISARSSEDAYKRTRARIRVKSERPSLCRFYLGIGCATIDKAQTISRSLIFWNKMCFSLLIFRNIYRTLFEKKKKKNGITISSVSLREKFFGARVLRERDALNNIK